MTSIIRPARPSGGRERHVPPLEAIVFDMGDILFDASAWRRWLARLLGKMGIAASYRDLFARWDAEYLVHVHCGRTTYAEAFAGFLSSWGLTGAQVVEASAASMAQKKLIESAVLPFPGVVRTLGQLSRAGFRLGVLSDSECTGPQIAVRLERLGLGRPFRAIISSFDVGKTKPDPACYAAALEGLGVPASRTLFVGHDADELSGASTAGLRTAAFNHEPGVVADFHLSRFQELWELALAARSGGRDLKSEAA